MLHNEYLVLLLLLDTPWGGRPGHAALQGRIPAFAARLEAIMLASIRGGKRWTARQALTMARNAVEHWAEGRPKGPMRGCPRDKHAMLR